MIPRNFFNELKRRHVYNVAVAYTVVAWLLIQIATQVFPFFDIPGWAVRLVVLLLVVGFPVAVGLAWAFEITPGGIKRANEVEPNGFIALRHCRKLTTVIGIIALLASILLVLQFVPTKAGARPAATTPAASIAAAPVIREKSIAVLPFKNLSDDKQSASFADGVQDEILTDLAKIADLKVISRTSVMQYRETANRNLPEIAQALKVTHVLEGSVQRADNRVRVTAQLIDARTDTHLWAERYDGDLADVFAIQTEIAQKIADQLQAMLSPQEQSAIQAKPTRDLYAHDVHLGATEIAQSSIGALPGKNRE
jgi:TolB-like protein